MTLNLMNGYSEYYYLLRNKDIRIAVEDGRLKNGFEHFYNHGHIEGREFSDYFDSSYYLAQNPDVAAASRAGQISAFQHFITWGHKEGRLPFEGYSDAGYLRLNPDAQAAIDIGHIGSAWEHFTRWGAAAGRQGFVSDKIEYGTAGNDNLLANGSEYVFGAAGNDTIVAATYTNLSHPINKSQANVYGNQGADTFFFNFGQSNVLEVKHVPIVVADFDITEGDKIRINHFGVNNATSEFTVNVGNYASLSSTAVDTPQGINLYNGNIIIEAVHFISPDMFLFG